jgi:polyphosphate kinase 2
MAKPDKNGKKDERRGNGDDRNGDEAYKEAMYSLQVELVKLQRHVIATGEKLLILFEGRDAAGKDGTIKRFIENLSPRETRVVALGKPDDREVTEWYFQRWVAHLPAGGEIVLYNRSWYNRAGVERVMGFCCADDVAAFFETVPFFEQMLTRAGIRLIKLYLDISREEQRERLDDRRKDPLKQWKVSPIDEAAQKHWDDYSKARDEMLVRTHNAIAPWIVVRADDKKAARLNVIREVLSRLDYEDSRRDLLVPDRDVVFLFDPAYLRNGMIAA